MKYEQQGAAPPVPLYPAPSQGLAIPAEQEWVTRRWYANYLDVSLNTVINLEKLGLVPKAHKLGPRTVRYKRSEIEAWAEEKRNA